MIFGLYLEKISDIERTQKSFLHIALGPDYVDYENALNIAGLETLQSRRTTLCTRFAIKAAKHQKHQNWFQLNNSNIPNIQGVKNLDTSNHSAGSLDSRGALYPI